MGFGAVAIVCSWGQTGLCPPTTARDDQNIYPKNHPTTILSPRPIDIIVLVKMIEKCLPDWRISKFEDAISGNKSAGFLLPKKCL